MTIRGNQINWNQVYYFSEVASCGSIKDAAAKLGLSPSTLSEHVTQLEGELELQLFYRHHRKLALTPEGQRLYLHAREMFEAGQRLIDVVSPVPLGCYPVSVAFVPSPSLQLSFRLVGDFFEKYGPFDMKVYHATYGELESGLSSSRFDFGFSDRLPERKDLVTTLISSSYVKFYVAAKWSGKPFSKLVRELPLLVCNSEPPSRTFVEQALADADLTPGSIVAAEYPSLLIELCQRGLGIGVFSEEPIRKMNLESLRSLRAPPDAPKLQDHLYAMWAKGAENSEAVRRLRDGLKAEGGRNGAT